MAICYRDMTFCASDCTNTACRRHFGPAQAEGARRWWSHDPENAPVAFSDFSDTCSDYIAARETKEDDR